MGFQFASAVVYGLQQLSGLWSYSGTKSCPKVEFITDSSLVWIMQELTVILIKRLGEYTSTEEKWSKDSICLFSFAQSHTRTPLWTLIKPVICTPLWTSLEQPFNYWWAAIPEVYATCRSDKVPIYGSWVSERSSH